MADFRKLAVWEKAHELALEAHDVAQKMRGGQYSSLRSQVIREAISIPANIVEGREQRTSKDFIRFLRYSVGSTSELEYHLIFGNATHLITQKDFDSLLEKLKRVRKMLYGLIARLEDTPPA